MRAFGIFSPYEPKCKTDTDIRPRTVAITPTKSRSLEFEYVRRVCQDFTLLGLKTMTEARVDKTTPFRFLYMSGAAAERDLTKTPRFMPEYSKMRVRMVRTPLAYKINNITQGETENKVLGYASEHQISASVAKPGLITAPGKYLQGAFASVMSMVGVVPNISIVELAAALVDQAVNGFEKDPLENGDMTRIGRRVLSAEGSGSGGI